MVILRRANVQCNFQRSMENESAFILQVVKCLGVSLKKHDAVNLLLKIDYRTLKIQLPCEKVCLILEHNQTKSNFYDID